MFVLLPAHAEESAALPEPDRMADDFVTVSLLVAEPGDVMYAVLGHATIRMQCPYYGLDYVFSYESEAIPRRVLSFLMGRLQMGMTAIPTQNYLDEYAVDNRGITEYVLNLKPEQKTELWRVLDNTALEGMDKPYDYIKNGCAVSCIHALRQTPGLKIKYNIPEEIKKLTIKETFYKYAHPGWDRFFVISIAGGVVDDIDFPQMERLIAPRELADIFENSTIEGRPLVMEKHELLSNEERVYTWFTPLIFAILLLFLSIGNLFVGKNYFDYVVLALETIVGLLITYLVCFSSLCATEWNWLIIPFNPLPLIFWKWRDKWGIWYAALIVVWCIAMLCAPHLLVEYAHLVFALAFAVMLSKSAFRKYVLNKK